jgi:2-(3-amino-3-carboxypropyl)histidine synthase
MYKFEEEKLIKEIKEKKPKLILLQLPEGLKKEAFNLAKLIKDKTKTEVIVSGEPCWGACDIALDEARNLKADLIVLYGHAPFMKIDFPIIYIEARYETNIEDLIKKSLNELKDYNKIALVCSVQHMHQLEIIKKILEANKKEVFIPPKKGFAFYSGQVLGCEYNGLKSIKDKIDTILVIGNDFHALGASLAISKKVILIDPFNKEVYSMDKKRDLILRQRIIAINKVRDARRIGVIIDNKPGQHFGSAYYIKNKLEKQEKEVVLLSMNEITDDKLVNLYNIDAFIETACPRISTEDYARFSKPVINYREALVVINDLTFEQLFEQGIV